MGKSMIETAVSAPVDGLSASVKELHMGDVFEMVERQHDDEEECSGNGGYRFDSEEDKAALKAQRSQLWTWLKNVGSNMFKEGINLTRISLPVCLFEPRSFLERLTHNFEYLDLLVNAANSTDPEERMKYVVGFALSGLCRQVSFHKPFNPILGETYQARFSNGVELFCEQISHHPPISSWQMMDPDGKFMFYGNGNWTAGIKGNHVKGRQTGKNCVQFADGSTIEYELPGITVQGVLWGQRCIKYGGEMEFKDAKNGLVCKVEVDPQPQQSLLGRWLRSKKAAGYKPDLIRGTLLRGEAVVDTCHGNWLHSLEWDKGVNKGKTKCVWAIKHSVLYPAQPVDGALESDARNREDVVFLSQGDQVQSQEWKHTLEEQQRKDRKLRKEAGVSEGH